MRRKTMIRFTDVRKRYYIGKPNELEILHGIDLEIQEGEFVYNRFYFVVDYCLTNRRYR